MSKPQTLLALQRKFKSLVQDAASDTPGHLFLQNSNGLSLTKRLGIYQYAFWSRIEESLEEDFPRVAKILGSKRFSRCVKEYINQYPSRFSSLAEVSGSFSEFLAKHTKYTGRYPYLSEIARLEWKENLAWLAEDSISNLNEMGTLPPQDFNRLIFLLSPTLHFLKSNYCLLPKKPKSVSVDPKKKFRVAVFRFQNRIKRQKLSQKQWRLLKAVKKGKPLPEINQLSIELNLSEEKVSHWFKKWTQAGIISGFRVAVTENRSHS